MGWAKAIVGTFRTPTLGPFQTRTPSVHPVSAAYLAPSAHFPPLNSDDKFLLLAGYLFAAMVVVRVSLSGAVLMIAILAFLAWLNDNTDGHA